MDITSSSVNAAVFAPQEKSNKFLCSYFIRNSSQLGSVLAEYPNTGPGSTAMDVATGDVYVYFGDGPGDWARIGG